MQILGKLRQSVYLKKYFLNFYLKNYLLYSEPHYTLNGREWLPVSEEEMDLNKITYLVLSNQPEFVEEPLRDRMLLWDQIEEVLETGIIPEERNLV